MRVFSVATGVCLRTIDINQQKPSINRIPNFVVDAQTAVYASGSHVAVWDIERGELLHKLGGNRGEEFVCVTLDVTRIAASSCNQSRISRQKSELKVWNRESGQLEHSIGIYRNINQLQLHNQYVICNSNGFAECGRVWNTDTGKLSSRFDMNLNNDIFIYNDQLVACAKNGSVSLYNTEGQKLSSIETGEVRALVGVFDNGFAVLDCPDRRNIKLVDLNKGKVVRSIPVGEKGKRVTESSDMHICKKVLAVFTTPVVAANHMLELIDFDVPLYISLCMGQSTISPVKARAMRAMKIDYNFRHSMKPMEKIVRLNVEHCPQFICMDEALVVIKKCFTSTSLNVVLSSLDGKVSHHISDCRLGECLSLHGQLTQLNGERVLVTMCEGHGMRVFSAATRGCLRTIDVKQSKLDRFSKLVVHAQTVAYVSEGHVPVWDIESGEMLHKLGANDGEEFHCVTIDANRIAAASSRKQTLNIFKKEKNELKLWNRQSGQLEHSIKIGQSVHLIKLHKQWVICGNGRVWNTVTGELSQPIDMNLNNDIFIYNDQLVVCSKNGSVNFYNMDGHQLSRIKVGEVHALIGVFDNGLAVTDREDGKAVKLIDLNRGDGKVVRSIPVGESGRKKTKSSFITLYRTVLAVFTTPISGNFMLELIDFDAPLPTDPVLSPSGPKKKAKLLKMPKNRPK